MVVSQEAHYGILVYCLNQPLFPVQLCSTSVTHQDLSWHHECTAPIPRSSCQKSKTHDPEIVPDATWQPDV